jgi:hypothetical protein
LEEALSFCCKLVFKAKQLLGSKTQNVISAVLKVINLLGFNETLNICDIVTLRNEVLYFYMSRARCLKKSDC